MLELEGGRADGNVPEDDTAEDVVDEEEGPDVVDAGVREAKGMKRFGATGAEKKVASVEFARRS